MNRFLSAALVATVIIFFAASCRPHHTCVCYYTNKDGKNVIQTTDIYKNEKASEYECTTERRNDLIMTYNTNVSCKLQ
jgi:hypothetical protein